MDFEMYIKDLGVGTGGHEGQHGLGCATTDASMESLAPSAGSQENDYLGGGRDFFHTFSNNAGFYQT